MHAYFDSQDGNPKIVIKVRSNGRSKYKEMAALFDTGHNGSLSLPLLTLIDIGAKLKTYGPVELADGNQVIVYYFEVKVQLDGKEKTVLASMIGNPNIKEAIVGLKLLDPYIAFMDFKKKRIMITTERQIKRSLSTKQ